MKLHQRVSVASSAIVLCLTVLAEAKNQCAPVTWLAGQFEHIKARQLRTGTSSVQTSSTTSSGPSSSLASSATPTSTPVEIEISPVISSENVTEGEVNCRYAGSTMDMDINYYTCKALADMYDITIEKFFLLNPELDRDCGNIKADTDYCVDGFIEPLRAFNGLCGPSNGNATCLGTEFQCCNANTFKCGKSAEDCADGTCYEGACAGDSVFTTNGECGQQHGYKMCAGVWGDCCNADGKCGTGEAFCGLGNCQLGNCTVPHWPSSTRTTITSKSGTASSTTTTTPPSVTSPNEAALPSCGKLCLDNMRAQHSALGCSAGDALCLCNNVNFGYGLRDCANGACESNVASTVTSFKSAYCSYATATPTPQPSLEFQVQPHWNGDCSGDSGIGLLEFESGSNGRCVDLNCNAGSLDIAATGDCPGGHIQLSYWQQPGCSGEWYGYGYTSRDTCRALWSWGTKFKSLWMKCTQPDKDCVAQGQCVPDAEPSVGICNAPAVPAFRLKTRYHADCTGDVHDDVEVSAGSNGRCIETNCMVGSLDITDAGDCPDGEVQISYWSDHGCAGDWYGYGYGSRNTCRSLWSGGNKFRSLWVKCAKKSDDCVSKGECDVHAEPENPLC